MKRKLSFIITLASLLLVSFAWGRVYIKNVEVEVDTSASGLGTAITLWPGEVAYTYPDSAESLFVVPNGSDYLSISGFRIIGLGRNWEFKEVTTGRLDPVTSLGVFRRVNFAEVLGDTINTWDTLKIVAGRNTNPSVGDVRAFIPPNYGRDQGLFYTIPDGKEGNLLSVELTPSFSTGSSHLPLDSATVDIFVRTRKHNGAFHVLDSKRISGSVMDLPPVSFVWPQFEDTYPRQDFEIAAAVTSTASLIELRGTMIVEER